MNKKALIKRKTQLKSKCDAELRACRAKWRRKINSVDRLLRASATANDIIRQTKSRQGSRSAVAEIGFEGIVNGGQKQGLMEVVRQALRHNQGFFTAKVLVELLNTTQSSSVTAREISPPLRSLYKRGEIRLVERGKGRKSHMYMKF
jgi:hypothetical protein